MSLENAMEVVIQVVFTAIAIAALYGFFWAIEWMKGVPIKDIGKPELPDALEPAGSVPVKLCCPECGRKLYGADTSMLGDIAVCSNCKAEFPITAP